MIIITFFISNTGVAVQHIHMLVLIMIIIIWVIALATVDETVPNSIFC